jgi:hypothetical protein
MPKQPEPSKATGTFIQSSTIESLTWLFPDFAAAVDVIAADDARRARLDRIADAWCPLVIGDLMTEIGQHLKTHGFAD